MHGVVLIKGLKVRIDPFDILPSGRNQHPQRSRQLDATGGKQLKHVVETGRIRPFGVDERRQCLEVWEQR